MPGFVGIAHGKHLQQKRSKMSTEKPTNSERIWDFTTINMFQTCRKYYYWRIVRNLATKTVSPALEFGAAIHAALDVYYVEGLVKALDKFRETYKDREGDELRTVANGITLLETYARVYAKEPFTVLGKPETGFVFPMGDILWGGRMDLPIEWDGQLWIVEHKTASRLDSNYFKQFALDKQITSYIVGAEEYFGRPCAGCLINVLEPWKSLKRPTEKSKKPEDHFLRDPVMRSSMLKDRFKLNILRIIRDIKWCEENNEFYEAEKKDACFSYNYACPYKNLCQYGEDKRVVENDFVVEPWQPYKEVVNGE